MNVSPLSVRAGIACALLSVLLIAAVWKLREDWRRFEDSHRVDAVQPAPEPFAAVALPAVVSGDDPQYWFDIASRNLFSFDRSDIAEEFESVAGVEVLPAPQRSPILFGTMAIGGDRMAMLGSAGQTHRSFQPIRVGESFDGWEIVEIQDKSVLVSAGGFSRTVIMNDPSAQIPRDAVRSTEVRDAPPPPVVATPEPSEAVSAPPAVGQPPTAPGPPSPSAEPPPGFRYSPFGYIPIRD